MKKAPSLYRIALSASVFLISQSLFSQTDKPVNIPAGSEIRAGKVSVEWILGENMMEPGLVASTGFKPFGMKEVEVYPTPTGGPVWIVFTTLPEETYLEIIDMAGKKLDRQEITNEKAKYDFTDYQSGEYLLKLISFSERKMQSFKIIKT